MGSEQAPLTGDLWERRRGVLSRRGALLPAPCKEGGRGPVVCRGLSPSLAQLWSPVQRQIQEEPLDSLSSSVRQQAMETLTQLRCPHPLPNPMPSFPWAVPLSLGPLCCAPTPLPCLLLSPCPVPPPPSPLPLCGSESQAHPNPPSSQLCIHSPSLQPQAPHSTPLLSVSSQPHPAGPGCPGAVRAGEHMREECVLPAFRAGHAGER